MNRLLLRQIKRHLENGKQLPEEFNALLQAISDHYDNCENERKMLERIIDVSSDEMVQLNAQLRGDIERRKLVENELRISQERYRTFIAQSSEGIWRYELPTPVDPSLTPKEQLEIFYESILSECNDVMAQMYGYAEASEITGSKLRDILPPNEMNDMFLTLFIEKGYQLNEAESKEVDRYGNTKYFSNSLHGVFENEKLVRCWGIQRDITEWRITQEKIISSESHLKTSQHIAKIGSWEIQLENFANLVDNTMLFSEETYSIYGVDPKTSDLQSDFMQNILHPDDIETVVAGFNKLMTEGVELNIEHRITLSDGTEKIVQERAVLEYDPKGKPRKIIGTVQDITEWKQIQEKIITSETHLKTSQHIAKIGSWELTILNPDDINSNPLRWSEETYRIFGFEPGEVEVSNQLFDRLVHPDDFPLLSAAFHNALKEEGSYSIEHRVILDDGSSKTVREIGAFKFDPISKKPLKVEGTVQDITEWKDIQQKILTSELHLKASQHIAKVGSWQVDLVSLDNWDLNPSYWSEETYRIYGVSPDNEEVNGSLFYRLVHPEDIERLKAAFKDFLEKDEPYNIEHRVILKDGTTKTVHEVAVLEYDVVSRKPIRVLGTVQDITERKSIEEKILTSETHLKASQRIAQIGSWEIQLINFEDFAENPIQFSEETYSIYGIDTTIPDTTIGKLLRGIIHPDDTEIISAALRKLVSEGGEMNVEHRLLPANGSERVVQERAVLEKDPVSGKPIKIVGTTQNITEWKRIQQKIINSEASLTASQRIAKVGSWMVEMPEIEDQDSYITSWSDETFRIFGLSSDNIKADSTLFFSMVHPDDVKSVELAFTAALSSGTMNLQHRIVTSNGEVRIVSEKAEVEYNPKTGHPYKIIGTTQDVTEQKMAELSLKNTEANLRTILENTDTAYALLDTNANILSFNQLANELAIKESGKEFIIGQNYLDWMSPVRKEEVGDAIHKVLSQKAKLEYEVNYQSDEGEDNWLYVRMHPIINVDEIILGLSISVTNISERKKNEKIIKESNERYNMATKATNDVVWDWEIETNRFYRSENYGQIFGYPTPDDNLYMVEWVENIHPDDRDRVKESVGRIINTLGATKWQDEYRFYRANGEIAYVLDKAYIIHDNGNRPIRMVGAMQDITSTKRAELEMKKLTTDLIQRNKDLEQFAYIVSHNLRAPVANMIGFAELLSSNSLDESERSDYMEALATSVHKLDEIIKDLNTILQVRREITELREPVKFSTLTADILNSISTSIKKEQIEVITDFSEVDEITTLKTYLYSIFFNLISNSIKYRSLERNSVIEIKSRKENNKIILTFSDNGMGIDLKRKGHQVFGLYKRFHSQIEGKGMGLYMVKTQVETLSGKIEVRSEVNIGTEFNIEFEV